MVKRVCLHLWSITFVTAGTKVNVEYKKLYSALLIADVDGESFPSGIKTFHLFNNTQHSKLWIGVLYNLDNDKIEKQWFRSQGTPTYKIPVSIPELNFPGWFTVSITAGFYLCYGGDPRLNPNPIARVPDSFDLPDNEKMWLEGLVSVGDVNHDR